MDNGVYFPARDPHAAYGSEQWEKDNAAEVAARPDVLPLDKRHMWSPEEIAALRANMAAGMSREKAIALALGAK